MLLVLSAASFTASHSTRRPHPLEARLASPPSARSSPSPEEEAKRAWLARLAPPDEKMERRASSDEAGEESAEEAAKRAWLRRAEAPSWGHAAPPLPSDEGEGGGGSELEAKEDSTLTSDEGEGGEEGEMEVKGDSPLLSDEGEVGGGREVEAKEESWSEAEAAEACEEGDEEACDVLEEFAQAAARHGLSAEQCALEVRAVDSTVIKLSFKGWSELVSLPSDELTDELFEQAARLYGLQGRSIHLVFRGIPVKRGEVLGESRLADAGEEEVLITAAETPPPVPPPRKTKPPSVEEIYGVLKRPDPKERTTPARGWGTVDPRDVIVDEIPNDIPKWTAMPPSTPAKPILPSPASSRVNTPPTPPTPSAPSAPPTPRTPAIPLQPEMEGLEYLAQKMGYRLEPIAGEAELTTRHAGGEAKSEKLQRRTEDPTDMGAGETLLGVAEAVEHVAEAAQHAADSAKSSAEAVQRAAEAVRLVAKAAARG
ncbi:MAG: hypothetical protein SGPRY_014733, partial [Prymnesium sp.]